MSYATSSENVTTGMRSDSRSERVKNAPEEKMALRSAKKNTPLSPARRVRFNLTYFAACALVLIFIPSCGDQQKTTTLDIALTDGTHTGGLLLAVDSDWVVLDETGTASTDAPVTLLDHSLVDTISIIGAKYDRAGAVLGGIVGAVGGIFLSGGLDSSAADRMRTRTVLGFGAGMLAGAALGYFAGGLANDTDIIIPHPIDEDYAFLRLYALYPDSLPRDLEQAIDSVDNAQSR